MILRHAREANLHQRVLKSFDAKYMSDNETHCDGEKQSWYWFSSTGAALDS